MSPITTHGCAPDGTPIVVRRSARRKSTVSAFRESGTIVVAIPESFDDVRERRWVREMLQRLQQRERKRIRSDHDLEVRARELSEQYLAGLVTCESVVWTTAQRRVWGTCTPSTRRIRLSATLQRFPLWVQDYVLLHELAHILEPTHNDHFWALLATYPHTDRARGFLEGISAAQDHFGARFCGPEASPGREACDMGEIALPAAEGHTA